MLTIALTQADGESTKLRKIAEKLVEKAIEGDMQAIKEVADRTDGKPMQQVEVAGEDGGPVLFKTIYETIRAHDELK